MKYHRLACVAIVAVALAACQGSGPKQTGGTLIGAGLGALAGSQIGGGSGKLAAVAIGALGGAWLGSEIGKSLDRADRSMMERNAQYSLENNRTGATSTWQNPDSGHSGTMTPTNTYQTSSGNYCREYETTVIIDGREERAFGRACRQPDGTWQVAN
ncbi:MAG: glycine zipper 2TM domain-containing protein [Hyphomicrobiales bacterium]|nr:glycine zipper 2TM domain-containing protein [Hyphomicrobiales bacterium]MCP5370875.1 glycine zipper 2TM domain-containing protein [Hyphomicrobiales bacterium]